MQDIRLRFDLDTDADEEQLATLLRLTERFCVVYQTLRTPPEMSISSAIAPAGDGGAGRGRRHRTPAGRGTVGPG